MRKLLFLALAATFSFGTAAIILAQDHQNTTEKTVKQTITLTTDTRVGDQVLKAGTYRVTCDREMVKFQSGRTVFEAPCLGPEMAEASKKNEIHTSVGSDGLRVLTRLLLKGSNVEHSFQN